MPDEAICWGGARAANAVRPSFSPLLARRKHIKGLDYMQVLKRSSKMATVHWLQNGRHGGKKKNHPLLRPSQ